MRPIRNFIWTLTAIVVLALAIYLSFTAARWLNRGSSQFFWNTTSVIMVKAENVACKQTETGLRWLPPSNYRAKSSILST